MSQEYSCEISSFDSHSWSKLLAQFADASIYQTWSYGAVRWGKIHIDHVIFRKAEKVIGVAQACVKKMPGLPFGIAYIPWGPLWQMRGHDVDYENFRFIIHALVREYCERRRLVLRIDPHIFAGDKNAVAILEAEGLKSRRFVPPYRTCIVDLQPSLEEIRKRLDQKWRNQLNRAEKNGLTVTEGNNSQLYQVFLDLQRQMLARKGFVPGVDYEEFGRIQEDLPDFLKMRVAVAEFDSEPVAVAVISGIGDTGVYLLGATGDDGTKLKGSYLIQWKMIEWLKASGCRWYDLGGINPVKNPGVFHFKSGLSGVDSRHVGQYEFRGKGVTCFLLDLYEFFRKAGRRAKAALHKSYSVLQATGGADL